MYITYHGTAAAEGVPGIFCECDFCRYARAAGGKEIRMRPGALIDDTLKIDFGPDCFAQMIRFHADYSKLEHVIITHSHEDHLAEINLSMVRPGFCKTSRPLTVYGNAHVGERLSRYLRKGRLHFVQLELFKTYDIAGYCVTPLEAVHAVGSGEQTLFYLIEKDSKRLLYAHDTDLFPQSTMDFLKGKRCDLISLDCTDGILTTNYKGHMSIAENLLMRERLTEIGAADEHTVFVANHFSHNGLVPHEEMEKRLSGFTVAYDGLTLMV
jgi:phosphoribosyl 1,2-cyclic phosphate phosphodiesterase